VTLIITATFTTLSFNSPRHTRYQTLCSTTLTLNALLPHNQHFSVPTIANTLTLNAVLPKNQHLSVPYNSQHFNTKHRIATKSTLICSLQLPTL